jgi:proton-coupled amino acid transporter
MFLPKAFSNGGVLFSSMAMLVISIASAIAFHLLLQCKSRHGGGYGEIGGVIGGPKFRTLILGSITLSQLGFVCAGIVFVAENLTSFLSMSGVIFQGFSFQLASRQLGVILQFWPFIPELFVE